MCFPNQAVIVNEFATSTVDFRVPDPGFIQGTITVSGGGVLSFATISANPSVGPFISSFTSTTSGLAGFYRFAVNPVENLRISVAVFFTNGVRVNVPQVLLDVLPGETVVLDFDVPTPTTGVLQGTMESIGPNVPTRLDIFTSGSLFSGTRLLSLNGPYEFAEIPPGTYFMTARTWFNSFRTRLDYPDGSFDPNPPNRRPVITAGSTTTVDISSTQAFLNGSITIVGTASVDDLSFATIFARGVFGTATQTGLATDRLDLPAGTYNLILTERNWAPETFQFNFLNLDPGAFLNESLFFTDEVSRANPISMAPLNTAIKNFGFAMGSVTIGFSIAGGTGATFSSPRLTGFCTKQEPGQPREWFYSFSSSGNQQEVETADVTFVGMEGTCSITTSATVDGTTTIFGRPVVDVVPGAKVIIDIGGPTVSVEVPAPDLCSDVDSITVTGLADDDIEVADVTVNVLVGGIVVHTKQAVLTSTNNPAKPAEVSFEATVLLSNGENVIESVATDTSGKTGSDTRTVVIDLTDDDNDGVIDCIDNCLDLNELDQTDTDGDGAGNACDPCFEDPNKIDPGVCGCGVADFDSDGDGVLDCNDDCPTDGNKTAPGVCGCGVADVNEDGDAFHTCQGDCDDTNPAINPDAQEVCDEIDHNCDGQIDDEFVFPFPDCLNQPPVCDANGPYSAECAGATTTVALDGTGSSDPDNDPLTYSWTTDCPGGTFDDSTSATPTLTVDTSPGCSVQCTVTLTVTDGDGASDTCSTTVTITDTTAPTVTCPGDATLECPANTSVGTNGSATGSDFCDPAPSVTSSDSSVAGCGNTETITRTWTATDNCGLASSCDQTIAVVDTTPPVLSVDTTPITVTDVDCSGDEAVTLPIPSATDTCGGVTITDDAPATFPAGQTTTLTFTATDDCGNSSSASVDVTVLFGADIWVTANKHTIGGGSNPGSTKEPFVGILICAYDKADGSLARVTCGGISHQRYQCIVDQCTPINCCTTDADGKCNLNLPPGDYVVISADATKTVLPNPLGVSASDLVCGEHKQKHLQQICKPQSDGSVKKTPGKTTRRTGSELLIIEPEFVIWDGTVQEYPFVFETLGDWGITASVTPPEGFVSDYDSLSADVYNEIEAVQFTITEVGSDLVPTGTTFEVTHKGRREIIHSKVDIFLTAEYARSRGFNVAQLRAIGLIKELPDQAAFGQSHRESDGE